MTARAEILAGIRRASLPPVALPAGMTGIVYDDLCAQFARSLTAVGGACLTGDVEVALRTVPAYLEARTVASLVPGVARTSVDLAAIRDPHELRELDFCVLPGDLGVAESGAVWVTRHGGIARSAAFLAQHLALVLPADALVSNLHEAYERLTLPRPGFGVFISGPSKTADIEQALVIGAHGARSCTVVLTP